ncbi:hypothetical protein B0T11DRAFT_99629 [Plectosphaerella cucumerina]|uniref:Uncharacterized protein n=1 Tax=Plectosphaerella cucumerina TaxID=40658 RepID=A0A8K0X1C4_9PEZI|nr:hypothetical protein B0T11DRAFT_99629 [Plectosphaerella cucumerina]
MWPALRPFDLSRRLQWKHPLLPLLLGTLPSPYRQTLKHTTIPGCFDIFLLSKPTFQFRPLNGWAGTEEGAASGGPVSPRGPTSRLPLPATPVAACCWGAASELLRRQQQQQDPGKDRALVRACVRVCPRLRQKTVIEMKFACLLRPAHGRAVSLFSLAIAEQALPTLILNSPVIHLLAETSGRQNSERTTSASTELKEISPLPSPFPFPPSRTARHIFRVLLGPGTGPWRQRSSARVVSSSQENQPSILPPLAH